MSNHAQLKKMLDIMAQFVNFTAKKLPDDVIAKLQELSGKEDSQMAKIIYDTMFRNQKLALELKTVLPVKIQGSCNSGLNVEHAFH